MPVDFDSTLLAASQTAFGEPVTYTAAGGAPLALTGVFLAAYKDVTFSEGAAVTTVRPVLDMRLSAFGAIAPAQGDRVTVRGAVYNVADLQPDGIGGVRLILQLAR